MFEGILKKMISEFNSPINYFLDMGGDFIHINQCIGKILSIDNIGSQCLNCYNDLPILDKASVNLVFLRVLLLVIGLCVQNLVRLI